MDGYSDLISIVGEVLLTQHHENPVLKCMQRLNTGQSHSLFGHKLCERTAYSCQYYARTEQPHTVGKANKLLNHMRVCVSHSCHIHEYGMCALRMDRRQYVILKTCGSLRVEVTDNGHYQGAIKEWDNRCFEVLDKIV